MNNNLYDIISPTLKNNLEFSINNIKILLYKGDNEIFEHIDFNNDKIYQESLLHSFYKNKKGEITTLEQIIIGYKNTINKEINVTTDEFGRIYIPNVGWFTTTLINQNLVFSNENKELFKDSIKLDYKFESIEFIKNTNIEILKYQIPLLKQCYINVEKQLIDVEIENVTNNHLQNITKAYNLIKTNCPNQYELIEKYAPKCVIFNVDTYQRNSFASKYAYGIGFFNAYQEDYDEVFFVDDIAHQTGHTIFDTLLFDPLYIFKIDCKTILETIKMPNGDLIENRDLLVISHALYTYYTSFNCLNNCLENNVFTGKQKHEAMGRIAFYIGKCYRDALLIDNPIKTNEKAKEYFTNEGLIIYTEIKNKWFEMYDKWYDKVKHFDMSNQPYNFTYSKFKELNPIN